MATQNNALPLAQIHILRYTTVVTNGEAGANPARARRREAPIGAISLTRTPHVGNTSLGHPSREGGEIAAPQSEYPP